MCVILSTCKKPICNCAHSHDNAKFQEMFNQIRLGAGDIKIAGEIFVRYKFIANENIS